MSSSRILVPRTLYCDNITVPVPLPGASAEPRAEQYKGVCEYWAAHRAIAQRRTANARPVPGMAKGDGISLDQVRSHRH
eukprot:1727007-Rhodomonas_salina.1